MKEKTVEQATEEARRAIEEIARALEHIIYVLGDLRAYLVAIEKAYRKEKGMR